MYPSDKRPRLYASGAAKKREKKRRLDNAVADTSKIRSFFVTTTAGEDETSEGNPENSKRDAVDVAPSVPAPEDEAAAEPTPTEPATAELTSAEPAMWTGSSGVRPDARQPDRPRSLSTGHIANRTENDNYSSRHGPSCCPKGPFAISSDNGNIRLFSDKNTTMHILGQWK